MQEALQDVLSRIESAKKRAHRTDEIKLVAVTKYHPLEELEEAVRLGVTAVGENRVQEMKSKFQNYKGSEIEWHLIGHLQLNKVRQVVPIASVIQSVDSEKLLAEIDRIAARENKIQSVLLQVNIAGEEQKSGIEVTEFPHIINVSKRFENVRVEGLMCMAPIADNSEEVRPIFRRGKELFEEMKAAFPEGQIRYLSMGMSDDFEVAIEEGANIVRVGSAIFGERDYSK